MGVKHRPLERLDVWILVINPTLSYDVSCGGENYMWKSYCT